MSLNYKSADWKSEKHVPVIDCPDSVSGEFAVTVTVGKEIPHPNTVEHHIRWIRLYFTPEEGLPVEIACFEFSAHGEGGAFTASTGSATVTLEKSGTLTATSYCNLHGLWESSKAITVG
ncbi:MAG: Neelaredoxin [Deltaproteobacteria bacterium]|nr:MAG: Neelaredoxin [Deltaproteobacteria bacterium]